MASRGGRPIRQHYGDGRNQARPELGRKLAVIGAGLVSLAAGLALAGFVIYKIMCRSDFFQVTETGISGCVRTTKNQILEMSEVDVHSNLLAIDLKKARARIEAHGWVKSVELSKDWPNRLTIKVRERSPVAIVSLADGLFYLDQDGAAFTQVLPPESMDYPLITGLTRENWPRTLKGSQLGEALHLLKQSGQGNAVLPRQNISELHLDEVGNITMYLVDRPFPIHFGAGQMGTKYYWLTKVLYRLYKSGEFEKTMQVRLDYGRNQVLVGFSGAV